MTITTVSIACDVGLPNNTEFTAARLDFTLSGPDYDTVSNDSIPAATVSLALDAAGTGTASLWPVDRGTRNTFYSVVLHGSRTVNGRVVSEALTLGRIQPQSTGGADLANLLAQSSGGIVVGSTIYATIADAVAAALDAAVSAEADAATATTQAGIATTQAGIATDGAQSATTSADEAEAFAAAAAAVGATFPSVSAGIAGVADGEVFFVPITGGIGLTIYQRAGAGANVIGSVQGDTFDTRAAYAAWVAAGGVAVAGRTYLVGGRQYIGTAGATDTGLTRLLAADPALSDQYGIPTGGTTPRQAALNAALPDQETLKISGGKIYTEGQVNVPANTTLGAEGRGDGLTRSAPVGPTGRQTAVQLASGAVVDGVAIDVEPLGNPSAVWTSTFAFPVGTSADVKIIGVDADAGIEIDPLDGSRNGNNAFLWVFDGENVDGLTIKDSTFRRHYWGILQANTTVATYKNTAILSSRFLDFASVAVLFNAPEDGALYENVLVAFNEIGANLSGYSDFGPAAPGFPHRGSFAGHVEYSRLIGNHMHGNGWEAFRAEESAVGSVWVANTAKLNGARGFDVIPNNAYDPSSPARTPTEFVIGSNVLRKVGSESEAYALTIDSQKRFRGGLSFQVYNGGLIAGHEDASALSESVIHDNVATGFGQGLVAGQGFHRSIAHHNMLADNEVGISTFAPSFIHADNVLTDNTVAIRFNRGGGLLGRVHFRSRSAIPAAQTIETPNADGGVTGWTYEAGRSTYAAGLTVLEIVDIGILIDADVIVATGDDASAFSYEVGRLTYDGTSLIYQRRFRRAAGGFIASASTLWGIKNGHLGVGVFNSTGAPYAAGRVQVSLNGIHVWN